jgi:hypothetical protein
MKNEKMEIRCCCTPMKLMGYVYADPDRDYVHFTKLVIVTETTHSYTFPEIVSLPVKLITNNGRTYRAVKAEGMELDDLKKLTGFIPV